MMVSFSFQTQFLSPTTVSIKTIETFPLQSGILLTTKLDKTVEATTFSFLETESMQLPNLLINFIVKEPSLV